MIRTLRGKVQRYGPYSRAVQSQYDHRMGARSGLGQTSHTAENIPMNGMSRISSILGRSCQINHALLPMAATQGLRVDDLPGHLKALRAVGVPHRRDDRECDQTLQPGFAGSPEAEEIVRDMGKQRMSRI